MDVQRKFIAGEEWLYYKVYSGISIQEYLLLNVLPELVAELYQQNLIDKFFFVRYSDITGPHLRLRFHMPDSRHTSIIIHKICAIFSKYLQTREILSICIDTYIREIERYGAENIEDIETLFSINSWDTINYLKMYGNEQDNWLCLIKQIDSLFDHSDYNTEKRHELIEDSFVYYWNKFGNKEVKEGLKKQHRENISKINGILLSPKQHVFPLLSDEAIETIIQKIKANSHSDLHFDEVLRSIIHMFCNRFFAFKNNIFELVIYYMMSNYYKSSFKKNTKHN